MIACRGCGNSALSRVVDLGKVPAADHFPLATDPVRAEETSHALAMDVCHACGLAQLADDDTVADEPRGVEPQALKDQAEAAIQRVAAAGWLRGDSVLEFGSPHGGTWIPLLTARGFTAVSSRADVVLDCFGIMHEPDQRIAFAHYDTDGICALIYIERPCMHGRKGQYLCKQHAVDEHHLSATNDRRHTATRPAARYGAKSEVVVPRIGKNRLVT